MRELVARAQLATCEASRRLLGPSARSGQGTVEYVGLILLVALLMVGMVAAMKGFQGKQGWRPCPPAAATTVPRPIFAR